MAVTSILSPNSLSDMNVEAELKLRAINKKLQMESTLDDIFESLGEDIVSTGGKEVAVPDAIFLKLEAAPQGARQVTVPLLMALSGAPTIGATTRHHISADRYMDNVTVSCLTSLDIPRSRLGSIGNEAKATLIITESG